MAQIVIEISEYDREFIHNAHSIPEELRQSIAEAIINGVELPLSHGRLIDADACSDNIEAARYELMCEYEEGLHEAWEIINDDHVTPTLVAAHK